MKHFRFFFLVIFIFFLIPGYSQEGMLKGFIYDHENGEAIGYCPIQLQGTVYGTMSESNGSFIIDKIPVGKYIVQISFFGYDNFLDTVEIKQGVTVKRYFLYSSKVSLDAVQITAESQRKTQETRISMVSVTPKEMSKMPAIGGQPDFAQYLQVLPGIVSTGDQGGQLYVRGGTPTQNMLLLDGMIVYNPFHSIGLFSVFDSEIMSNADVYTGGYGAEFGGRISSVMDIQTRDGNKKRLSGKIDLTNIGAQLLLEGPFVKLKDNRKTSLSFILSAKGSFLEQSSKIFYPYIGKEGLPYNFFDFYTKLTLATTGGTKLNIFGFNFDDRVNYSSIAAYKWNNWGLGANFLIVPGSVPTTIEGNISYSKYVTSLEDKAFYPKESSMNGFTFKLIFNYYVGKSVFNIGLDVVNFTTKYSYYSNFGTPLNNTDYTTDLGVFVKYKYNFRNIVLIEPSFRLQYYASLGATSPEPRLAIKYNISKTIRLKLAGGLYSQNFVGISSDRDVVNLFYGFISTPDGLPSTFDGKEIKKNLQKAQHVILGLELDVLKYTSINVEGYFKNFSQLIALNRYKIYEDNPIYGNQPELLKKDFIWEKGCAYGGDLTVKFDYKGFYFWGVYSLGWVKRYDGVVTYAPHFDRRHNINLLASYAFGKRKSWQFDVRWNFGTGFPFTQTQAYYPHYTPSEGIGDDYVNSNEDLYILLADLNKGRLPNYHRLDIGAKKKFFLGERNSIEISLSITNVYDYSNIFYVNRVTNDVIYQLPILYYFGMNWRF